MNDILILGATGRVGAPLTERLLQRGASLRALVRDPERARASLGSDIAFTTGDLRDTAGLRTLAAGCHQIVFVAGANGIAGRGCPREIEHDAVVALVEALDPNAVERVLLLSSAGVTQPEHPHNCSYDSVLKWKARGEAALRRSGLRYTIVRALGLRDRPAGAQGVRMVQGDRIAFGEDIARGDLAAFLADLVAPVETGFDPKFDRSSLVGATIEVFNDATLAGGHWGSAARALIRDGAGS